MLSPAALPLSHHTCEDTNNLAVKKADKSTLLINKGCHFQATLAGNFRFAVNPNI
jgi:hypothetical protein